MNPRQEIIGKTITGIIAAPGQESGPVRIWMLQFSDGTHVEFVSPQARKGLKHLATRSPRAVNSVYQAEQPSPQMSLNVA